MTTGTWQPASTVPTLNDADLSLMINQAEQASTLIRKAPLENKSAIMKQNFTFWEPLLTPFSNEQIWALIRFFTLAEEADSQWFAGEHSPAIHCNTLLKQRGVRLSTDQLQWIRANSSNRFIPNGPLKL